MTFKITAATGAQLSKQIDKYVATLPAGDSFPANFGRAADGTWYAMMQGHYDVVGLSFAELTALLQKWIDTHDAGSSVNVALREGDAR